ncbi:MAG: FAD-dependent 5-carboxymethylaminomethyl-2-thiouridine(34) oxidoreductase MnmC [Comamonas sp.]|nr:FAD-dependent 5-carboxymethylaminomethyl-2-thiouridine(34) oxidoreductase MnmC [Comamonas sp.]
MSGLLPNWLAPLPRAWAQHATWRVLDVSGNADALLALHRAVFRAAPPPPPRPAPPAVLHYVLVLSDAQALQTQAPAAWQPCLQGLLPGVHRLALEGGALQLTLWLGPPESVLRQQSMVADTILIGSAEGASAWLAPHALKPLLRHCQRGTQFLGAAHAELATLLTKNGCTIAPETPALHARFDPPWTLRKTPPPSAPPGTALVIGAGLAGSSAAWSLAQRGWHVTVLGQSAAPADGASGLPAGLFCPHTSPDDCVLSRLSRAGLQTLLPRLEQLCQRDHDWAQSGVLEHDALQPSYLAWKNGPGSAWSQAATATQCVAAGLPPDARAVWHHRAGWLRPAALVAAQLKHPRIRFIGQAPVAQLRHEGGQWQAQNAQGQPLAAGANIAIVAAGMGSSAFLPALWRLQALRGQVTVGPADNAAALPPFPVNGSGNLVPQVPGPDGAFWVMGSTFERDVSALPVSAADQASAHAHNLGKLAQLLPATAQQLQAAFTPGDPACQPTWARVRVASHDRLPIVGPVLPSLGLFALTALGARGITLSALCGELLAAQLHAEPLPLEAQLAQHLGTHRLG